MINSHPVPQSVLLNLSCSAAGLHGRNGRFTEDDREEVCLSKYFFRSDIANGRGVTASECSTRQSYKPLCKPCEDSLKSLDDRASFFWECLPKHSQHGKKLQIGCRWCTEFCITCEGCRDITSVFLFSVIARQMHLTSVYSDELRNTLNVFVEESDRNTYPETTAKLEEINFLHFVLPTSAACRIEFPFECFITLDGSTIKTVCAQLPPFFVIMPKDDQYVDILRDNIDDIIPLVRSKLQEKLESFCGKEEAVFEGEK